jgi:hypothetical protein
MESSPTVYTHPETGETVEIPAGAVVDFNEAGEVTGWSNPSATVNPLAVEDYEPQFDRLSVERRVLGHVTDLDHSGRGPRNTPQRLSQELAEDPNTAFDFGEDVQGYLDDLEAHGLLARREDGSYEVTQAGQVELAN